MKVGKLNPKGKINFPGFQKILDFTSSGSESSVSVNVDGDTDEEYFIVVRNSTAQNIMLRLNNNSASSYGRQYLDNSSGSISAARDINTSLFVAQNTGIAISQLLTPAGLIKTLFFSRSRWSSGTTISEQHSSGQNYNSTANITTLNFVCGSGNFTSDTRITVFAKRSN